MVDSLGGNLERVQRGDAGSDVLQRFTELFLFSLPLYGRLSILESKCSQTSDIQLKTRYIWQRKTRGPSSLLLLQTSRQK